MFFKKNGKIREDEDRRLVRYIEALKETLTNQSQLIKSSVDPSEEVILRLKIAEAKYFFLLKEARMRNASVRKPK